MKKIQRTISIPRLPLIAVCDPLTCPHCEQIYFCDINLDRILKSKRMERSILTSTTAVPKYEIEIANVVTLMRQIY